MRKIGLGGERKYIQSLCCVMPTRPPAHTHNEFARLVSSAEILRVQTFLTIISQHNEVASTCLPWPKVAGSGSLQQVMIVLSVTLAPSQLGRDHSWCGFLDLFSNVRLQPWNCTKTWLSSKSHWASNINFVNEWLLRNSFNFWYVAE